MDKPICLECHRVFESDQSLHKHIKVHKLKMFQYYYKHFPRHDKYTGEPIKFRDKESYFYNDFNNKENLKLWLEQVTESEAKIYIKGYFFSRKERKNLVYAPSQVELRSLPIPGMLYLSKLFGSYKELCDSIGLKVRFPKNKFTKPPKDISKYKILIDTREQNPLKFNLKSETVTLNYADYKLSDDEVSGACCIERKAIDDFHGTLGRDLPRFKREMTRAKNSGAYVVVVIESPFESVFEFQHSSFFHRPINGGEQRDERPVVSSPYHIFHGMREIMEEFDNVQFLFVNDRKESVRVIEKLFASGGEFKEVDLQYAYDTKTL